MIRATVIIPTYQGRQRIRECLRSVLDSRGIEPRVVVFDNASTDGTRDIVANEFPQVELIESPENIGFARANNRVLKRAVSRGDDYAFLLNEDAKVDRDTLVTLIRMAEKHDVSILSPLHYDYPGETLETDFGSLIRQERLVPSWEEAEFVPTSRVIGAAVLLRLSTLRKIGLFDPIYFLYAEEEDLCRRAHSHGYRLGITPRARIYHGHQSTGDFLMLERIRRFNIIRGKYILVLKNPERTLHRALLVFFAEVARDLERVFGTHSLTVAWDFLLASIQVLSSVGRILRRRRLESRAGSELWTNREIGIDTASEESHWL